ncbi:adenylate/guanylate cyclase domain-containing protein [Streptomyces aidingensis]|uniref:Predicted ATPase n=1 Tax=Streptomyces aidingensis TaxID=910347 RepID=A0A1I1H6W8_9ACTN|nr:adenylate/guanylate cyclase domain-containing protein [Streptomyces aidingensis]SFC17163.1 Predicted ATPase [Streptomyces aidingensis]
MSPPSRPAPCPSCAEPPPAQAAFCPRCGTPCAAPPGGGAPEERRVVTVVFCDLVGSTALAGRLDPEALRAVTLRYFTLMRDRIEAHGGTVEKYIGDAVMAVFGVPVRHEDDARRALAAALDMVAGLETLNTGLGRDYGVRLGVRIGVNTGEVVAGTDPAARQALVTGEVVNVAARLEQQAAAGEILIGPATALAAGPAAVTEDVGELALRGKRDPVPARRLLDLHADDPERTRRFDTPFVGREPELAQLGLLLDRLAAEPRSHLVTVYGEAGAGKTRLLREWLGGRAGAAAAVHGAGRCRPYGEHGSLAPLADAVGQALAGAGPGPFAALTGGERAEADAARTLLRRGLLADGTPSPSPDDTCLALHVLLSVLARHRPLVLVLDDVHWATAELLEMTGRLLDELDDAAVAVVCAARPELLERHPGWGSGRLRSLSLTLGGLARHEAAALAAAMTGGPADGPAEVTAHARRAAAAPARAPDQVLADALERAEGNPLHLEHLLEHLLAMSAGAPAGRAPAATGLPPTLQGLLGARIDALDPEERTLLQLAAVLGREFGRTELAALAVTETEPAAADPAADCAGLLRRLVRRRMLEPVRRTLTADPGLRFGSGLVQEAAYDGMAKAVRARRHLKAAEVLSAQGAPDAAVGPHLARAHHYRTQLGGPGGTDPAGRDLRDRAARTLLRAGAAAQARSDLPWAADLLARARELCVPADPFAAEAARRLGEVRAAAGAAEEGRALLTEALRTARAAGDGLGAAHAELALAALDPRHGSAADAARRALPLFTAAGDDQGIARACVRTAQERQRRGRHAEAESLLHRALTHAARADAEPERAMALGAVGISLWRGPTPVPEAVARCRELLDGHGTGRPTVRAVLGCPLAVLLALQERWTEARERLAEAEKLARGLGYAEAAVFVPLFAAEIESLAGRTGQVPALLDAAGRACRELGDTGTPAAIERLRARTLLEDADGSAALDLPDPREAGLPPAESADADGLRARAHALAGRTGRALELAGRAAEAAESTDSPVVRGTAALDLARTLHALDRPRQAADAAAAARRHFAAKGHRPGQARAAAFPDPPPEVMS